MLLILTSETDLAADYLIVRLIERKLPYRRLNSEELDRLAPTFGITANAYSQRITFPSGDHLDLSEIGSVWYRRAIEPRPNGALSTPQRHFVAGELRHLWMGMALNPDIRWVNPIEKVFVAEHKLFQLKLAAAVGFRVPNTVVSTQDTVLNTFVQQVSHAVCKPIFHGLYVDEQGRHSIYTRRVTDDELPGAEEARLCPVFLQEEIHRKADIRATFVGDKCFAVRITARNKAVVDWRVPGQPLEYSVVDLPADVQQKCKTLLNRLGLRFGAFDFIESKTDELVFLEVNPTGEWAWLENRLGLPIRDALIDDLLGGVQ